MKPSAMIKCGSKYFLSPRLLGGVDDPKKRPDCNLTITYKLGSAQMVSVFHETQEILFGDMEAFWNSRTDVYGGVPDAIADELLHKYRPLVWLDEQELSFPCRVEWYLPQVEMLLHVRSKTEPELRALVKDRLRDPVELIMEMKQEQYLFRSSERKRFMLQHKNPAAAQCGEPPERLAQIPFYGNVVVNRDGDIHLKYVRVCSFCVLIFFFSFS